MITKNSALCLAAGLLLAASAQAEVAIVANIGTTGAGAHLVVPMEKTLNGRFGLNGFSHNFSHTADSIDYDLKAKLQTVDFLFDWYLSENGSFHLTGGVVYNGNKFEGKAKPNGAGSYTINGKTYSAATVGSLNGNIEFRKAAPYLGIGWGNALATDKNWHFSTDLGAIFQGSPQVQLVSRGCTTSVQVCSALAKDVATEQAKFADDVKSFKVYPVVRVALAYRF
jgi:hypothetical protein